jgi:hypothetical protein
MYDILFKSISRKSATAEAIYQRQSVLIKTLIKHLVQIFEDYFKLAEASKHEGTDI